MSTGENDLNAAERFQSAARALVTSTAQTLEILRVPSAAREESEIGGRRRGGLSAPVPETPRSMILVDRGDGALEWRDPPSISAKVPTPGAPRRSFRDIVEGVVPLVTIPIEDLPPNKVVEKLASWDQILTPNQGLRILSPSGVLSGISDVPPVTNNSDGTPGRILLIVHGTFSNSDAIFDQLKQVESNSQFLVWARGRYQHILTFDHPTMSVSPVLNALDLTRYFANVSTPVDVICHSRGGLVTRWWLEAFAGAKVGPRRVVFVAAPLGGTSLASPDRIRKSFDLFTTVGTYLKQAGEIASVFTPFATIAVGLMRIFVAVTGAVAYTPLADLFFSAVPGLGAMSRVGNNTELNRLQLPGALPQLPDYFAVYSDFQMEKAGWKFWKLFQDPGLRAASWGASLIFQQANDLVVDNRAAIEVFQGKGISDSRRCVIETNGQIYHTNYFLQTRVLSAFQQFLS